MNQAPRRRWLILVLGVAALGALLLVLTRFQEPQLLSDPLDLDPKGVALRTVTVYYMAADTLAIVPQERTMVERGSRRAVVEELILFLSEDTPSHRGPLPAGTRLAHLFENDPGELVLDLAGPLDAVQGGSLLEDRLRLTALVRTLAENVEGLDHLRLLVHGRPLRRWGRHIHLEDSLEMEVWL